MRHTESVEDRERARLWASTMRGHADTAVVRAHADTHAGLTDPHPVRREERERRERESLAAGATLAVGAGERAIEEEPDEYRTCFQKDHDRIVHSTAFRRLAGKTQVVVYPRDHQRTRLTHALEVAQVAQAIARAVGANATLAEAIALGHDCGHGPGGHASETAFEPYIPGGFEHGPWAADVVLAPLNLTAQTLDGIRNHSWSRPAPSTPEGEIVSWADRIAYCAHDLEDALHAGIVTLDEVPGKVVRRAGRYRSQQLGVFIRAVIETTTATGTVGMPPDTAEALAELRQFNYERIYMRPDSIAQGEAVIALLRALLDHYIAHPSDRWLSSVETPDTPGDLPLQAVTYVAGMTDRFAFEQAEALLDWDLSRIPPGIGRGV